MDKRETDHLYQKGVYGIEYHEGRKSSPALKYRVRRRTEEVASALTEFGSKEKSRLLDVGTADGLMLDFLQSSNVQIPFCVGVDYSFGLLRVNTNPSVSKLQSDALSLPVKADSFDAVVATAVIEHVADVHLFLNEIYRVLRCDGILIISTPNPALAHLAEKLGLLKEPGHQEEFSLSQLRSLVMRHGYHILKSYKFMFSPVGFPAEKIIEKILIKIGLSVVMANQLIVCQKSNRSILGTDG